MATRLEPDLALVDIHLQDGVTGVKVADTICSLGKTMVVFMSGNANRIPENYAGAVGYIGKPYTEYSVMSAMSYLSCGLLTPPPSSQTPSCLTLSPQYSQLWAA